MSVQKLAIGLLGASRVATYAVIEPARASSGYYVHGVAARDPDRADGYAAKHGIECTYRAYEDLLNDPRIDLVYLGTPPAYHVAQALAAIAVGKPVLVEKPFALDAVGARRVFDAANVAGVQVFEAMHSPHHVLFSRLLTLVGEGCIGKLIHVDAVFDAPIASDDPIRWSATLGGGALMDLGVYPLAWVRRILGERFTVEKARRQMLGAVDSSFTAHLRIDERTTATVSSSMITEQPAASLELFGERGSIFVSNPLAPQHGHALTVEVEGKRQTEYCSGPSTYEAQLDAVRAAVSGERRFPFPADDFVRSMAAIDSVRVAWIACAE